MVIALLVVIGVVAVREGVRALIAGKLRPRAIVELRGPGSHARRAATIAGGAVAMYLAVVAVAFGYAAGFGFRSGPARFSVGELISGGAAEGVLAKGDVIETIDGEPLFVGVGKSLTERVNAKGGTPVELGLRGGKTVRIEPRLAPENLGGGTPRFEIRDGKAVPIAGRSWLIGIRPKPVYDTETSIGGAAAFGFAYPVEHAIAAVRGFRASFRDEVEVVGVTRFVEALEQSEAPGYALMSGLVWSGYLLLFALLFDLVRLAVLIRDRVRA